MGRNYPLDPLVGRLPEHSNEHDGKKFGWKVELRRDRNERI